MVQSVTSDKLHISTIAGGNVETLEGSMALKKIVIGCSNAECNRATYKVMIGKDNGSGHSWNVDKEAVYFEGQLFPSGRFKPQPDYIPVPIVEDYVEACQIVELSPKAAATLARRCIQGMIRDFCGISKATLFQEIGELRNQINAGTADRAVSPESIEALDHVRKIGNIGAHMEADINLIVPVDPDEAKALIDLIELLFEEWYVAKRKREERFAKIESISIAKDAIKKS